MMSPTPLPYKESLGIPIPLSFLSSSLNSLVSSVFNSKIEWERLSVLELLKWITMLLFYFSVWIIRSISIYLPCSVPTSGLLQVLNQNSFVMTKCKDDSAHNCGAASSHNPIGRALCQVLALVNDIPVSSEKYEFAQTLAEKIIQQNTIEANATCMAVNRYALAGGFSRTLKLLTICLERLQRQEEFDAYLRPWRFIRPLFLRGLAVFSQMLPLASVRLSLINMFPRAPSENLSSECSISKSAVGGQVGTDCLTAEKFAQELLWISQKLKECSAIDEAIVQWSSASSLASLSLSAHPRVQSTLLRICVLLLRSFSSKEVKPTTQLKVNFILLWLPLLCYAKNGYNTPRTLSHTEKVDVVSILEVLILSLPSSDQEMVLASWLQDYSLSSSDWPNLQWCYERWFQASFQSALQSG